MPINTRWLMRASALAMAVAGLPAIFMPQELAAFIQRDAGGPVVMLIQLLGALYFGFAALNWMAQGNLVGGIYSRPVTMANLLHFAIAGLALLKAGVQAGGGVVIGAAIFYAAFAVMFGLVMFGDPLAKAPKAAS